MTIDLSDIHDKTKRAALRTKLQEQANGLRGQLEALNAIISALWKMEPTDYDR